MQSIGDGYNTEFEDDSEEEEEENEEEEEELFGINLNEEVQRVPSPIPEPEETSETVNKDKNEKLNKRKQIKNKRAIDFANDLAHQRKMNEFIIERIEKLISMTAGEEGEEDNQVRTRF